MWSIYSETWGSLKAEAVHSSVSFPGMITAYEVSRSDRVAWEKIYLPLSDLTAIVPPEVV
jgi:hypothetical protein